MLTNVDYFTSIQEDCVQNRLTPLDLELERIASSEHRLPKDKRPKPTQATPEQLQAQIEAAEAAQRKLDEQKALEAEAAQLFQLQQQQQNQQWIANVLPVVERTEAEAVAILQNVQPQIEEWQSEFLRTVDKLERLVAHLPSLQKDIYSAAEKVKRVAITRIKIAKLEGEDVSEFAPEFDYHNLWQEVGGTNDALSPLPLGAETFNDRQYKWLPLIASFSQRSPFAVYNPKNLNAI